jgi:Ca2+-transporting ATPase
MDTLLHFPWTQSPQDILKKLEVNASQGLDPVAVRSRRKQYGRNRLQEVKSKSAWLILADQCKSLIVLLLAVAAALSFLFGEWVEGIAIVAVILLNAAMGFVTELKAVRSMEALQKLSSVSARVLRAGETQEILAEELVPGDIVLLEGGDIITADLRVIEASKLQADESALTGESVPVSKSVVTLEGEVPLAERTNMLFKGTALTRGSGKGVVVATGMHTELGRISSLVAEAKAEITPLKKRLDQLGHRLIWVTLGIAVLVALMGIIRGKEILLMIETAIALAVAAIPEGLPIVATMALARGMMRMARRNALINRLAAVETLGATKVICTDKTGTLTENRMTVTQIVLASGTIKISGEGLTLEGKFTHNDQPVAPATDMVLREALAVGLLCNNASLPHQTADKESTPIGDPLEVALLVAGAKAALSKDSLLAHFPEAREEAFDADVKMMATFHKTNGYYRVAVKGAPEAVLEVCSHVRTVDGEAELSAEKRKCWHRRNEQMAEEGLRVLAFATKTVESVDAKPYEHLTFLGLAGLLDPPRHDVRQAIAACQKAGIRVIMVTGDQPATARNVGAAVGLITGQGVEVLQGKDLKHLETMSATERQRVLDTVIFARVNPKQKLDLIALYQQQGAIVAMTGDGVNDAPALKKADIGVAMGQRGTQVAREAADMVLKDDAFATIAVAVEQGRIIFQNIRKFVFYLLSCNMSEILTVSLASGVNAPLPILPLQILFLNLVTDVFPALALGMGKGDPDIMQHSPRDPAEPIMTRQHWLRAGGYGVLIALSVLGAFGLAFWWKMEEKQAVTISFLTLAFAQLWHVFNMRDPGSTFLWNDIIRNPFVWGALVLCSGLLLVAVYLPGLAAVLHVVNPGVWGWLIVITMSLLPWIIGQLLITWRK